MKVGGANNFLQLDDSSNGKDALGISIINPPCAFHIDPFFLSSFSTNGSHTVWVTNDGKAYARGDNRDGKIFGSYPKSIFNNDMEIIIDKSSNYKFISVICGYNYTLYLVSNQSEKNQLKLLYCHNSLTPNPLFLNIGNSVPQALFGGDEVAGVISKDGRIIVIPKSIFKHPKMLILTSYLPNGEKAVKLAFCEPYVIALSSSGRVYESVIGTSQDLIFNEVLEFQKKKVVDISGVHDHCLVVLNNGMVFGRGNNANCKLCMPKELESIDNFKSIDSINKYKIVSVFTGSNQSIFMTDNYKMIVCGYNRCGQLFTIDKEVICQPKESEFIKEFCFCVCGGSSLAVFESFIPKNMANQKIVFNDDNDDHFMQSLFIDTQKKKKKTIEKKDPSKLFDNQLLDSNLNVNPISKKVEKTKKEDLKDQLSSLSLKVEMLQTEISKIEKENSDLKKDNSDLSEENSIIKSGISYLKKENSDLKKENSDLKKENSDLKKENSDLKKENSDLKKENSDLKKENSDLKKEIGTLKYTEKKDKEQIANLEKDILQLKKQIKTQKDKPSDEPIKKTLPILDVCEIENFEKVKRIGIGATSEVFEVNHKIRYALKVLDGEITKDDDEDDENDDKIKYDFEKIKGFVRECDVLNELDHPNIIKMYGFSYGDSTHEPAILLEYCQSNLKHRLKKLNNTDRSRIIVEISSAMQKIHSVGIIHRDLKLENILLDEDNHVKVSDFGLCTFINNGEDTMSRTQMNGTLKFMAPELIQGRNDYDEKVDVYAFGVVVYLILTNGEYPNVSIVDVGLGKQADIPDSITEFSSKLISSCWSFKSSDRPSFADICELLHENEQKII